MSSESTPAPWAQTYVLLSDVKVEQLHEDEQIVRAGESVADWVINPGSDNWRALINTQSYKLPYSPISLVRTPAMRVMAEGCGNTIQEAMEKLHDLLMKNGVQIL